MFRKRRKFGESNDNIAPDEIFLDDRNIPDFDVQQFEGRIEKPIPKRSIVFVGLLVFVVIASFITRVGVLSIREGEAYAAKSEANRLEHQLLFPERGIITDRRGTELAWNVPSLEELGFSLRAYTNDPGFGHILGFLHYPARDKSGVYYREDYEADVGIEAYYNDRLKGQKGLRIIETDALGNVRSSNVIDPPRQGDSLTLTIDAGLQALMFRTIKQVALEHDFHGGAGGMMDLANGELLALVSFPDFDSNIMTAGSDHEAIVKYNSDTRAPFLDRAISGLYTPGSVVKPIYAIAALNEGIISPNTSLYCPKSIEIPNPYFPDKPSIFNDWKDHGYLDMRGALAESSDVYFYNIGGGFKGQKGLGVENLEKYARMFGFGSTTGIDLYGEASGTIPNPAWKAKTFDGDPWRIGDTYFTAIGQYGAQVTLLQELKEAAIIASNGMIPVPHLVEGVRPDNIGRIPIPEKHFAVIHEGMRAAVLPGGTATALDLPWVDIGAKTGTAQLGVSKTRVNSWVIGFFPYDKPRFVFAFVMERGPVSNPVNATAVAAKIFLEMASTTPEYFRGEVPGKSTTTPKSEIGP
jgi:penicillin-binding protein 2